MLHNEEVQLSFSQAMKTTRKVQLKSQKTPGGQILAGACFYEECSPEAQFFPYCSGFSMADFPGQLNAVKETIWPAKLNYLQSDLSQIKFSSVWLSLTIIPGVHE